VTFHLPSDCGCHGSLSHLQRFNLRFINDAAI